MTELQTAIDAIQDLTVEARSLRRTMRRQNRFIGTVIGLAIVAIAGVAWLAVDNRVTNEKLQRVTAQNQADIAGSNRKWCPVIGAIIQPDAPPPATERGEQMANLLSALFVQYGCTPADLPPTS